jgi:hypothetical protein
MLSGLQTACCTACMLHCVDCAVQDSLRCTHAQSCKRSCVLACACRDSGQLLIQWHTNGRTKWVKRLNLILQDEDRAGFRFRLLQAQRRRDEVRHVVCKLVHMHMRGLMGCVPS